PVANPLLPPSVGSGAIKPSFQRNGRHIRPEPQKFSPNGSGVEVSAAPVTSPLSLRKAAELFGPPSVPRSVAAPFCQRKARGAVRSRSANALPTTEPLLFTALAAPAIPPNVPRSVTI